MSNPRGPHTVLIHGQPLTQVKHLDICHNQEPTTLGVTNNYVCGTFPGGGGSSFYPETLNNSESLHHRRQFSFGFDDPGCSHLVFVEGNINACHNQYF